MSEATTKDYEANAKAQYSLIQALNDDDLSRVINCKSVGPKAFHPSFDDD